MDAIPVTFHLTSDEVAYLEVCLARRRELLALGDTAVEGQVLARCESAAGEMARQHARDLLTHALTRRVASAEKKGHRPDCVGVVGCGKAGAQTSARC